jgi:hypothetical protein
MEPLSLLQELILAAAAGGDGDLASWPSGQADDPDAVERLTAAPEPTRTESLLESEQHEGRWLLEHGFTGTITDTAGHKRQYVDGKQVKAQQAGGDQGKGGAGARTPPAAEVPDEKADAEKLAGQVKDKGKIAKAKEAVRTKLEKTRGGRAVLAMGDAGAWLFHHFEKRAMYVAKKTQAIAVEAAKARGLSDEGTEKLKRALAAADFLGGYATGGAAAAMGLPPLAIKAAAVAPSASVIYLAYSTARNPLATWKAAKKVVGETFAKGGASKHESEEVPLTVGPELATAVADRIGRSDVDSEWWLACFCAALAATKGDAGRAVELADAAAEYQPNGPDEE